MSDTFGQIDFDTLSNKELFAHVRDASLDKEAADALEQRWIDFWEHAQRSTGADPELIYDRLLYYKQQKKECLDAINSAGSTLKSIRRRIERERRELGRVTNTDWHALKRKLAAQKRKTSKSQGEKNLLKDKVSSLERQLWKVGQLKNYYERELTKFRTERDIVEDVQRELIEENLRQLEASLRKLVLYEAGVLTK